MLQPVMKGPQFKGVQVQKDVGKMNQSAQMQSGGPAAKSGDMYDIDWPQYNNNDVQHRVKDVIGSVSVFAPYPHEEEPKQVVVDVNRPITPIKDEIRVGPKSFEEMAAYMRRRIIPRKEMQHISLEDQSVLAGIIMGELNHVWPDIRRQVDDPFLSADENIELTRRLSVYTVTLCERLFLHYCEKAQLLNERNVFSGPANMSRLTAQLTLEASKMLNIVTIRRYVVADMKGCRHTEPDEADDYMGLNGAHQNPLSPQSILASMQPDSSHVSFRETTPRGGAHHITASMPSVDPHTLSHLISNLPTRSATQHTQDSSPVTRNNTAVSVSRMSGATLEQESMKKVLVKRCGSMPAVHGDETIADELGLDLSRITRQNDITYDINMLRAGTKHDHRKTSQVEPKPKFGDKKYGENDLKKLISRSKGAETDGQMDDDDLPALLQAITVSTKHDGIKRRIEKQMEYLAKQEEKEQQVEPLQQPEHIQPATVTKMWGKQMPVRTSDVRVSERVCLSSITLHKYPTVYNDLIDEVDATMVKQLDKSMFLRDEIREVYREIMKTVPTDHMDMDNDDLIDFAPEHIDFSDTMASSTLTKKKKVPTATLR